MSEREERLEKLIEAFMSEDNRMASSADEKCQKIYDHLKTLVAEKETFKQELTEVEGKDRTREVKEKIRLIDEETNRLLDLLSKHSMNF